MLTIHYQDFAFLECFGFLFFFGCGFVVFFDCLVFRLKTHCQRTQLWLQECAQPRFNLAGIPSVQSQQCCMLCGLTTSAVS